jgi:outer membrane protein assembly factor BamB
MPLPGSGVGRTRGVTLGRCDAGTTECLYLTTDFSPQASSAGLHALAVSLSTGQLLWQFTTRYAASGPVAEATPAPPALMDLDGDDHQDTLVFGDLTGRLWALDLEDGRAYGNGPVFTVPGGTDEPIGAGVAVHDKVAVFGTGGVEDASNLFQYALYAVHVSPDGGSLRWRYPLQTGEKVWGTPVLDAFGNVIFTTASNYLSLAQASEQSTSGRLVSIDRTGAESSSRETAAATVGRVFAAPGIIVSVDLKGEVTQFGTASRLNGPIGDRGSVRILSWRAL